jgi:hypothetical protein
MGHAFTAWLHAAALSLWNRREDRSGQGTVEYVGVVVMVTLLIAAIGLGAKGWAPDIGGSLKKAIAEAIKRVVGSFG